MKMEIGNKYINENKEAKTTNNGVKWSIKASHDNISYTLVGDGTIVKLGYGSK